MGLLKGKDNGLKVVNKALAGFEKMEAELDKGIELCNQEEAELQEELKGTKSKLSTVALVRARAQNAKNNLHRLFS